MNIGIITTWFERGAAYVSKTYMDMFQKIGHEVFIYARGGDSKPDKNSEKWNETFVTRDNKYNDTQVDLRKFYRWIKKNKLAMLLFNEQRHFLAPAMAKKKFPKIIVSSYVDYYTEDTLSLFKIYDFLICNTHRHLQAMQSHPQAYYLKWCVDTDLYKIDEKKRNNHEITFFHSVGMSKRKGTDILVDAFLDSHLCEKSKLIIHTQIPIQNVCKYNVAHLKKYNIDVVEKTVGAPGLYSLGDIYVYPTRLDGLGLTIYEAMSSGMPVITTDYPPMNEVITDEVGALIKVADHYCRADAYYYPMAICDKTDLIFQMRNYIDNPDLIEAQSKNARQKAVENYSMSEMQNGLTEIMNKMELRSIDMDLFRLIRKIYSSPILSAVKKISENNNNFRKMKNTIYSIGLKNQI